MTTPSDSQRNQRISLTEAFFSSFMIGSAEAFFSAYALSKGMGEILSGMIAGLPLMMGALLQLWTPSLFTRLGRPRLWVLLTAAAQLFCLLLLGLTSRVGDAGPWTIFLLIGLYWAFSFAGGTVWNYWMGHVVPAQDLGAFFPKRLRITQYGIIAGLLLAGSFLNTQGHSVTAGPQMYLYPFGLAFLVRLISTFLLSRQTDMPLENVQSRGPDPRAFLRETWALFQQQVQVRRDFAFLFLFNITIYISSSFATPFLLAKLKFDYLSYMAAVMALYLGKILSLLLAQKWIRKIGVRRILFWGALGMSPLPAFWILTRHTLDAVLLQALSGFFWGFFEVAVGMLLFAELPTRDKVRLLTWYNLFQTSAILLGTLIGAKILASCEETIFGYFLIFAVGSGLRTLLVIIQREKIIGPTDQKLR